eukprot:4006670-Lingulodinium_polyedra.AAC.1
MSFDAISWSGLLSHGLSSQDSKFLLTGLVNRCCHEATHEPYWAMVIWCLVALMSGKFPAKTWDNEDWPQGCA